MGRVRTTFCSKDNRLSDGVGKRVSHNRLRTSIDTDVLSKTSLIIHCVLKTGWHPSILDAKVWSAPFTHIQAFYALYSDSPLDPASYHPRQITCSAIHGR